MSCQPPNQHKPQMESSLSSWRGGSLGQRSWSTFILHSVGVLSEYIRLHVSPPRSGLSFFKSFSIFHWSYFQVYFIYYWIIISMKVGNVSARIPTTQHGIRTLPRVLRTCIAACSAPLHHLHLHHPSMSQLYGNILRYVSGLYNVSCVSYLVELLPCAFVFAFRLACDIHECEYMKPSCLGFGAVRWPATLLCHYAFSCLWICKDFYSLEIYLSLFVNVLSAYVYMCICTDAHGGQRRA